MDPGRFLHDFDPQIASFWAYWNGLPKTDWVPHLRDYLDNVPPKLQPHVAIIDVFSAERFELRLLGTVMSEALGATGPASNSPMVYDDNMRAAAARLAWTAVSHPCGYVARRPVRSQAGQNLTVPGIALPLRTARAGCKTMVNFSGFAKALSDLALDDRVEVIEALGRPRFIDIGNGVPKLET